MGFIQSFSDKAESKMKRTAYVTYPFQVILLKDLVKRENGLVSNEHILVEFLPIFVGNKNWRLSEAEKMIKCPRTDVNCLK